MNKYDSYNPTINDVADHEEEVGVGTLSVGQTRRRPPQETSRGEKASGKKKGTSRNAKPEKVSRGEVKSLGERFTAWATSQTVRWITATGLLLFAAYLAIAFISYMVTLFADQSEISNLAVGAAKNVHNSGGEGGARISSALINDGFGIGAAVIVFWMVAMSLKLFGSHIRFKAVDFTIKCLVALIAVSLLIGLITIALDTPLNLGGAHGRFVNQQIIDFCGWIGAMLLAVFVCAVFVILCLRDLILWIIKMKKKADHKRKIIAEEKAEKRKRQAELEEISRQEQEEALQQEKEAAPAYMEEQESEEMGEEKSETPVVKFQETETMEPMEYAMADDEDLETPASEEEEPAREQAEPAAAEEVAETAEPEEEQREMTVKVNEIAEATQDEAPASDETSSHAYKFPPYDLLREGEVQVMVDEEEQRANEEKIRETLNSFGINITSITATVGPTVTLYEIVPERGVKIAAIRTLVDDIALTLSAIGVRIIAPIPGKGTVGIEVANRDPQTVSMRTVIKSKKYQETKFRLPLALGSTISNEVYITDLAKMPHLLVAGATGQGKSVGMNAIIASLLYCKSPKELKFVMIDPKCVEFSFYNKIEKHYLAKLPGSDEPIITDMQQVVPVLNSLCVEMDNRYQLLKAAGCKNLEEYNGKIKKRLLDPREGHEFQPYLVLLVDEYADLVMTAGKEVEKPIARLAQKARAVGIHVIIATQRPSADVITGIIKANFPARMAFRVTNGIDSKTILQSTSAQSLIGRGDMLISNNSELVRVQCAFIDTPEVEALCDYIERQPYGGGAYILPEPPMNGEGNGEMKGQNNFGERDALFNEIAQLVVMSNTASTSHLQRRYSIGYNRAGKIMDQLEAAGIVGPSQNGQPRKVLINAEELEAILGE